MVRSTSQRAVLTHALGRRRHEEIHRPLPQSNTMTGACNPSARHVNGEKAHLATVLSRRSLYPCPHPGLRRLRQSRRVARRQRPAPARGQGNVPRHLAMHALRPPRNPVISGVSPDLLLLAVQKPVRRCCIS